MNETFTKFDSWNEAFAVLFFVIESLACPFQGFEQLHSVLAGQATPKQSSSTWSDWQNDAWNIKIKHSIYFNMHLFIYHILEYL